MSELSPSNVEVPTAIGAGEVRHDARNSRLSMKHSQEEDLRKLLLRDARRACDVPIKAFVDCGNEKGLLVIFSCRKQNQGSECNVLLF